MELTRIAALDAKAASSSLAMSARVLATKLDAVDTSPTAVAAIARELREHMLELWQRVPPPEDDDEVDMLAESVARKLRIA